MNPPPEASPVDHPIVNIQGTLVALGPMRRELVPLYHRWENDYGTMRTDAPSQARPITLEEAFAEYDEWVRSAASHRIRFTVYEIATWRPVGSTILRDLEWQNRAAVFGITIGEPECRGKGYGTEATRLTLDQAFTVMGLRSVLLDVIDINLAGIRAYTKAGFREVGRWRESQIVNGRFHDTVFMDCVASEFQSPVLANVLDPEE